MPDFSSVQPVFRSQVMPGVNTNMGMPNLSPGGSVQPSISPTGPTYADVIAQLNGAKTAGDDTFNTGIAGVKGQITAPGVLDPGYQSTLDQIKSNANYYGTQAGSAASALAARRGLAGSSIEQFGVQTGINNVNRTAADQTAAVYQQNLARQQALQDQLQQMYTTRAGQQTTQGTALGTTGAQMTSDEIASQRNMQLYQQQLAIQQQLGMAGINQAQSNTDAASRNAVTGGLFNLGGSLIGAGALGPGGLGLFGSGAAGTGLFSAGAGGAIPGLAGGAPLVNGAIAGTSFGSGLGAFAGAHPGAALVGAGIGAMYLANQGQKYGGTVGSIIANPIGAQLNLAKSALSSGGNAVSNATKSVANSVKSVFRF